MVKNGLAAITSGPRRVCGAEPAAVPRRIAAKIETAPSHLKVVAQLIRAVMLLLITLIRVGLPKKPGGSLKCGQVFLLALGKNPPPWALSTIRELTVVAPEASEMTSVTRTGYAPILYSSRKYSPG